MNNKLPNVTKTILDGFTEAALLSAVCLFLYFWFALSGIKQPTSDLTSTYTYSQWLASDRFGSSTLPKLSLESLCRHDSTQADLSRDTKVRCALVYPHHLTMLEKKNKYGTGGVFNTPALAPPPTQAQIDRRTQDAYANAQVGFQDIMSRAPQFPANLQSYVFDELYLRRSGSIRLECSWYLISQLQASNRLNPTQANLLKTELVTGGYAPYNRLKDHRSVTADTTIGMTLLPNQWPSDWSGDSESQAKQACMVLDDNPAHLYLASMQDLETAYMYRNYQTKTAKMDILADEAHKYFIFLASMTYLCLLILRRNVSFWLRFAVISAIPFVNYVVINRLLVPNLIGSGSIDWVAYLIAFIGVFYVAFRYGLKSDYTTAKLNQFSVVSTIAYPLLVLLLGVGYFVLFDWSINSGYQSNLFLALYQSEYIYLFFSFLSLAGLCHNLLFRLMQYVWMLIRRLRNIVVSRLRKHTKLGLQATARSSFLGNLFTVAFFIFVLIILFVASVTLPNQAMSVITRTAIILSIAYFLSQVLASQQYKLFSETNFLISLSFALAIAIQLATSDFGPIMILSYALVVLLVSEIAVRRISTGYWFIGRNKRFSQYRTLPMQKQFVYGTGLFAVSVVIILGLATMFYVLASDYGGFRSAERVLSMETPFSSTNDQRAMLLYFIDAVPSGGYGLGNTAWQGDFRGVPAQTQSDYYPMALYGVLGAGKLALLLLTYLTLLISLSVPRMTHKGALPQEKNPSAEINNFYAWAVVLWAFFVITQITLSIMGNFGFTPLTGITLPIFSYGRVELVASAILIGLFLHRIK